MIHTKMTIKVLLTKNDKAVAKAVVALYNRQTAAEQSAQTTKESNNRGFNGTDGEILSSFAQQYIAKGFLSPKQTALARKKVMKYSKQLLEIAQENGHQVDMKAKA